MKEKERIAQLEAEVDKLQRRLKSMRASSRELDWYVNRLTEMVKERRGGKIDAFMAAQVEITARSWRRLNAIDEDMNNIPSVVVETGSMGQQRGSANPLLPIYDKMQRTVRQNFQALGLNYDAMPSKVSEASAETVGDALSKFMESMSDDRH